MGTIEQYIRMAALAASRLLGSDDQDKRRELDAWRAESSHNADLLDSVDVGDAFRENLRAIDSIDTKEAWRTLEHKLHGGKSHSRTLRRLATIAALFCLVAGVGWIGWRIGRPSNQQIAVVSPIQSGMRGAQLELGDGRVVEVFNDTSVDIVDQQVTIINRKDEGLDYRQAGETGQPECLNTLRTLTGMEYTVTLSDGTVAHMNAESRLRYPMTFGEGERVVELTGEAYFEVARNVEQPFIVRAEGVEVRVLGTSFNLRAYPDEADTRTTLLTGIVSMNGHEIAPGQQAIFNRRSATTEIREVDTSVYTAWHSGRFVFRNERLDEVMKTLKRWYGIEYHFADEAVKELRIGASFGRYNDMEPILSMLEQTGRIDIKVTDKTVYLSMKKID